MGPPTLWQHFRQLIGRAFRETGQSLDRLGIKTASLALTQNSYYDDPVIYEDKTLSRHRHQFPLLVSGRPVVHPRAAYLAPCSTLIGSVHVGAGSSIWYGAVLRGDYCENAESFTMQQHQYHFEESSSSSSPKDEDEKKLILQAPDDQNNSNNSGRFLVEPWELSEQRWRDRTDHQGGAIFIGENTNIQDGAVVTARTHHCCIGNGVTVGHLAQIHSATVHDYCLIGMGSIVNQGAVVEQEALVAAGAVIPAGTTVQAGELWVGNPARKIRDLSATERERLHYQSSEYVGVAQSHKHVEELGGNVIQETGVSVYLIPAEDEETLQIESTQGVHQDDDGLRLKDRENLQASEKKEALEAGKNQRSAKEDPAAMAEEVVEEEPMKVSSR